MNFHAKSEVGKSENGWAIALGTKEDISAAGHDDARAKITAHCCVCPEKGQCLILW